MKRNKFIAFSLSLLFAITTVIGVLPSNVFANDNLDNRDVLINETVSKDETDKNQLDVEGKENVDNSVEKENSADEKENIAMNKKADETANDVPLNENNTVTDGAKAPNKIYVKAFDNNGGNGTIDHPYDNFKNAYNAANNGDIIVIMDGVPIQNDDNNSDQGVFTFYKPVIIEGGAPNGLLSSRVKVQLKADIVLRDVKFYANKVFLNGYTLSMQNVKTSTNMQDRTTIYGGSYLNDTSTKGPKSVLNVDGPVQEPFEVKAIYASSETGTSDIPVELKLKKGIKVLNVTDFNNVTSEINLDIGKANIGNTNNDKNSVIKNAIFTDFISDEFDITGIENLTLKNSRITLKADKSSQINGTLNLDAKSSLDISKLKSKFDVNNLTAEDGSTITVNSNGLIDIADNFNGTFGLKISDTVQLDHTYVKSKLSSNGNVKAISDNNTFGLKVEKDTNSKNWIAKKQVDNPIVDIQINGDKNIDLELIDDNIFNVSYSYKDQNGNKYPPVFDFKLTAPDGTVIDDSKVEILYDYDSDELYITVIDSTIPIGYYELTVIDTTSGNNFPFSFKFYKNGKDTYTVEFHSNDNTNKVENQLISVGKETPLKANTFTRDGYVFVGWATTPNGKATIKDQELFNSGKKGETIALYAVWNLKALDVVPVPTITATDKVITVGDVFDPLKDVSATDYEGNTITNITYESNVDNKTPGNYTVTYTATDKNGASVKKTVNVTVKAKMEQIKPVPTITATDKVITVGDVFDPLKDVSATDYEGNAIIKITYESNVDNKTPGNYTVTYTATDKNGASVKKTVNVTVKAKMEQIKPVPTITATDKVITVGDVFDPLKDVSATDYEGNTITNITYESNVDNKTPGNYTVTYTATDKNGASVKKTINVTVKAKMEQIKPVPTITATDKVITVGDVFDPLKDVSATDYEGNAITNITYESNVDNKTPGNYTVTYTATDKNGASVKKTINVTVKAKMEQIKPVPTITATDKVITVGDVFDPLKDVSATDYEGNAITKITYESNVDNKTPGNYTVTYTATDKNGASVKKTVNVTVKAKEVKPSETTPNSNQNGNNTSTPSNSSSNITNSPNTSDYSNLFGLIILFIVSASALIFLFYKKIKKKDNDL